MNEIIHRLKNDIKQESGTSPSFLNDLILYMSFVESFAKDVKLFSDAFPRACSGKTGEEISKLAEKLTK